MKKACLIKNLPLISVITAVFNGEAHLEETIKSVITQNYTNIEYLIIDGGSTDGTLDIIKKYQEHISYWVSEPDKGVYDGMNKGIKAAKGQWLNFMNSGDIFASPDALEIFYRHCLQNPQKSFFYGNTNISINYGDERKVLDVFDADHRQMKLIHQACIYKKDLHEKLGYYLVAKDVTISDYLFFNQVPKDHFFRMNEIIAMYNRYGLSWSFAAYQQKMMVDLLFKNISKFTFIRSMIISFSKEYLKKIWLKLR